VRVLGRNKVHEEVKTGLAEGDRDRPAAVHHQAWLSVFKVQRQETSANALKDGARAEETNAILQTQS